MEEKKLTDEEIAKAILQQVEYGAGIPYIDEWGKVRTIKFTEILDFIQRLNDENGYLKSVADTFQADYKNAKADGVRQLLQELIEMEIKLDPLRSGIRYKALIGYAEENGVEVDL